MSNISSSTLPIDIVAPSLDQLQLGDTVLVKRNLDHPAWKIKGEYDEYEGTHRLIPNPDLAEVLGETKVTERTVRNGLLTRVRTQSGFWYLVTDGSQEGSEATLIELIAAEPEDTDQ
jgi:hypothetical protein